MVMKREMDSLSSGNQLAFETMFKIVLEFLSVSLALCCFFSVSPVRNCLTWSV